MSGTYITVPEAARRLGITRQAVHRLVQLGRVHADKIGRDWLIPAREIPLPRNGLKAPSRSNRLGFSLIEVALSLGIAGLALVAMEQGADDANRQVKDAAAADDLSQVYSAAQQYIQANPAALGTSPAVGTMAQLQVGRTSSTGTIPAGSLQALGFLPSDYVNTNPYGQTHVVVLKEAANNIVEALVETTGGAIIQDVDLGRIAARVGANGGVVDSSPPPGITVGTMQGTGGGWSEPATNWTNGGLTPSAGHPIAVSYATQTQILQPWLYRNVVPGQPEANRMHTAIDMTHNALNSVSQIDNTDQSTGVDAPITVNSELVGNTVNNSQVNFQNGLFACKGNATGCQLQVSDDGGFVDNNDGWITFKGNEAAGQGLHITGTSNNLLVDGNTTTTGLTTANGGLVEQNYLQAYGDVQMKRTASHLAALVWPDASGNWSGGAYMAPDTSTGFSNLLRIYGGNLKIDGSVISAADYSAIYYDSANTAYYMQPSGTSNVNALNANYVYDYGSLAAGGGAFQVYPSGSGWALSMSGPIYASGTISSGSNIAATTTLSAGQSISAGTSISAGSSINAGTTITAGGNVTGNGVVTLASATAGNACATSGEIAQDTSGRGIDSCTGGIWTNSLQFTHEVVFSDNPGGLSSGSEIAFYSAAHANPSSSSPMWCHADTQNTNANFAVREEAFTQGSEAGNTTGFEDTSVAFFVQPGQSFYIYESANWDGANTNGGASGFGTGISTFCWY